MHRVIFSNLENPCSVDYNEKEVFQVYDWLKSQRIVKGNLEEIPQKCIDGTLFCELINKLEGRGPHLSYIHNPKTLSACRSNVRKALDFLSKFPRFKTEYMWSQDQIIHGDPVVIWGVLRDIMKYYPKYTRSLLSPQPSSHKSSILINPNPVILKDYEQITEAEINSVKIWLKEIGLKYVIDNSTCHSLKDPLRNGVMFCKVLNKIKGPFEFFNSPVNIEQVWENVNIAVWKIKDEIKISKIQDLIHDKNAWKLLKNIMLTYKMKEKIELPYSSEEVKNLKTSVFKWVFELKVFEQEVPEGFKALTQMMRTGIILGKIVGKIKNIEIKLIKYPTSKKECLNNIEKTLQVLQKDEKMSQGYIWDGLSIYKAKENFILGLLEDLHRLENNLPKRKPGDTYHEDGPFYGKFNPENLNLSRMEEKSPWNSGSYFMSPGKNDSISKSFIITRNASPFSLSPVSPQRNQKEMLYDNISPKVKRKKFENLSGFEWLKKIGLKLPSDLDLHNEKISEFRDGELLCKILGKLEAKDIKGFQKTEKGTAAAVKNVSVCFDLLRNKPCFATRLYFSENHILSGNGEHIRLLLKEIHKIYRNSIITLMKFHGTY